ncbi:hypothetical protein PSFL111601_01240 [Pseudomonas floridensis]
MSVGNNVLQLLSTPSRLAAIASIALMCASTSSMARDGVLRLHGSVVNSSCEVSTSATDAVGQPVRSLTVAPGVVIQINTVRNTCANGGAPFIARYQELPLSSAVLAAEQSAVTVRAGVVTLTYQ